jgi:hypothetical protein
MRDTVRRHRRFFLQTGLWFLVLSLPSLAFRWWHPDPLTGFSDPKYRWMAEVLRESRPVRMALVGSSRIWAALDAPRVSEALYGRPDAVVNLGTTWAGRDRDYFVARELVENLPTLEVLVLEAGRGERDQVHRYFHRLAPLADSFADPLIRPSTPLRGRRGWQRRINFWVSISLGNTVAGYAQLLERLTIVLDNWSAADSYWEQTGGSLRDRRVMELEPGRSRRHFYKVDPRKRGAHYIARIAELCRDRGVELVVVEVPIFREGTLGGKYRAYLEDLGFSVLSIEDRRELFVQTYWFDRRHLNIHGSELFSDWFVRELERQLIDSSLFD